MVLNAFASHARPVRRPDHSELCVHGGACRRRAVKFVANPFAILVVQQSKKILVVPGERTGATPNRLCIRSSHQITPADTSKSQVPISAALSARLTRSPSLSRYVLLIGRGRTSTSFDSKVGPNSTLVECIKDAFGNRCSLCLRVLARKGTTLHPDRRVLDGN